MIRALAAGSALALAALAAPAAADAPRSVITWLSNVIDQPAPDPERPETDPRTAAVLPLDAGEIQTSPLDLPVRDGVGTLASATTGLPPTLWRGTSALRARALILGLAPDGVPAARALYRALLLTEADPPAGSGPTNPVLLARVDALMAAGNLEDASALLRTAGVTDAALFRRAFDISLLTDTADPWCERLRDAPQLSPTLPARVYCSARLGDWSAAALTLNLGRQVGQITGPQEELLAGFLDPELLHGRTPPAPEPLTTLDFVLREAVALPRPSGPLPLAFSVVDARDDAPLRDRILARERLARAGALPAEALFDAYRSGTPAASGGVWDRMAAVQRLDRAFALVDNGAIAETLTAADTLLSDNGLRPVLAAAYATRLAALSPGAYGPTARHRVAALLLLAGARDEALPWLETNTLRNDRFLATLADAAAPLVPDPQHSALEAAIVTGLTTDAPPGEDAAEIDRVIRDGSIGEALLLTLALLRPGVEVDPGDLASALYLLRAAGLPDTARQVALETLLLLPEA